MSDPLPPPTPLAPGSTVGLVGLGRMGTPMATRLSAAGFAVWGFDAEPAARDHFATAGAGTTVDTLAELAEADAVVLMLPDSDSVLSVVHDGGLLDALRPGTVLVDMGSSQPSRTRELAAEATRHHVHLVDAPVSGGVPGAENGTLAVMVGGDEALFRALSPLLEVLGSRITHAGPVGAGHALKAINNLLSATHLLASSEALLVGTEFGLDPEVMMATINSSSGRSGSTENKLPNYVIPRGFDSGFQLGLLVKDMRIALGLAHETGWPTPLGEAATAYWSAASTTLPENADHTEVIRWLESGAPAN